MRKPPNMHEKLAAALLELEARRGGPVDFEAAKAATAREICARYQWDHAVYATWGGGNHPTNLTPRLIEAHRAKTAKVDARNIAKVRRAAHRQPEERQEPVPAPAWLEPPKPEHRKRKWPKRPFAGWRKFDGTVVRRDQRGRS
jgi:hypothetical protein